VTETPEPPVIALTVGEPRVTFRADAQNILLGPQAAVQALADE
jgi:hypothetical protein